MKHDEHKWTPNCRLESKMDNSDGDNLKLIASTKTKAKTTASNQQASNCKRKFKRMCQFHARAVARGGRQMHRLMSALIMLALVSLLSRAVQCQDIDDLNGGDRLLQQRQQFAGAQQFPAPQQQPQLAAQTTAPAAPPQIASNSAGASQRQRPTLSNRFAGQQPQQPVAVAQAQPSNIEQLMKDALARTARLEAADPRLDASLQPQPAPARPAPAVEVPRSRQQQLAQPQPQPQPQPQQPQSQQQQPSSTAASASAEPANESEDTENKTATSVTDSHETVYSEPRFASLFARRNTMKKSKLMPTEQTRAKPTLPSFIRSPPDPKQFTAASSESSLLQVKPTSGSFASARLQQQNQNRVSLAANQQKKPNPGSSSAAINSSKKPNTTNGTIKPINSNSRQQSSSSANLKAQTSTTNKPVISNNPFNRSQGGNNDQANVIAMARKRLLANNAIESNKLKQQQQQQQQQQKPGSA